jgi:hypothetical protein
MMTQSLIQRYQPGGDIYATLAGQYGYGPADVIAAAATTGDETQINAALVRVKYGSDLPTSTVAILGNQLATDPLAAPFESANNILGNTFASLFKNPWVLAAVAAGLFFGFGGFKLFRSK